MSSLYDRDFVLWSEETARAISGERWSAIDKPALAHEAESLGKRDRRGAGGRLAVIVTHNVEAQVPAREGRAQRAGVVTSIIIRNSYIAICD